MPNLTKQEFADCLQVADAIMQHLVINNWQFVPAQNFANCVLKSRLSSISVILSAVYGAYTDIKLIKGNSNITICIPNQNVVSSRVTNIERDAIRRVIFGVLVHECTHKLQELVYPTTFASAVALEKQFHGITSPTIDESFDLYIGQRLEQEARASQAAAELWFINRQMTPSQFSGELKKTEVWRRTESRIGGTSSPSQKVTTWWKIWSALAWDIYN